MKKILALTLVVLLLVSCCGCGSQTTGEFDHIVQLLEQEDYDGAKAAIDQLQGSVIEDPVVAASDAAVIEPVEVQPPAEIPVEVPAETTAPAAPAGETRKLLISTPITKVDNLGNEDTDNHYFLNYDSKGRIIKIGGYELAVPYGIYLHTFATYLNLTYTPDGMIENVKVVDSWDTVSAIGTPTYDENRNLISMHIQSNTNEYTLNFSYDANGNRLSADVYDTFGDEIGYDIRYTYDANGLLIKEVWNSIGFFNTGKTVEYTYDESGTLAQSITVWHKNSDDQRETTVYHYDNDGDIIQAITTSESKDSGYKTKTTNYYYDYLTVNP